VTSSRKQTRRTFIVPAYFLVYLLTVFIGSSFLAADTPYVSPIHYRPKVGVLADTIPFYWKGEYHIFYLRGSIGKVPWEHIVSKDLIHWKELPTALRPDGDPNGPDGENMFTGSVIEKDGTFHIFFTGWNQRNPKGREFILHATSHDLIHWTKHPEDILGPDGVNYDHRQDRDFRDAFVFWNDELKTYWMILCANSLKGGGFGVAESKDLKSWRFAPALKAPNQECPDLFKIGDTWYLLGGDTYSFSKDLRGEFKAPPVQNVIDRPAIYAGKRMYDGRRHIWTGWVWDSNNGRDGGGMTWGGTQCLPRELYAGPDGQLYQRPVEEISAFFNANGLTIDAPQPVGNGITLPTPDHYMLQCTLRLDPPSSLTIAMRQQADGGGGYQFILRPKTQEAELRGPGFSYVRRCTLDMTKPIKFQAFVQGSIIECFVNDQFAYTCRAYNYSQGALGLKVEGGQAEVLQLAVKTYENNPATVQGRIVAREDFDVSGKLAPPEIMQRRFWNMMTHYAKLKDLYLFWARNRLPKSDWKAATGIDAMLNEPMIRQAAVRYEHDYFPDLRAEGNDSLVVNADRLRKITPDPKAPFVVGCNAGRPPFRCLDDFRVDRKDYENWKREHPNFLGFWTGTEWENEFIGCVLAEFPGVMEATKKVSTPKAIERINAMKKWVRADRDAAVRGLHECYKGLRHYYFDDTDKMLFLRSAWCFDHYALEWGAGMAIYESTITGPYRHQVGLFHVRGAARQYNKPWEWYMATYYHGFDKNGKYSVNVEPNYIDTTNSAVLSQEEESGPDFGMSVSLKRRDMYLAYLSGASIVEHEDWPRPYCRLVDGNPPKWTLSPHGEAMKQWFAFTQRHPERGTSYAPVALLTPFSQGMPVWGGNPWEFFPSQRPDAMLDGFLYTIVPNTQDLARGRDGGLSNSPFGDIYDVLAANPPSGPVSQAALTNYKAAILLGKHDIDAKLAERLMEYVRQGGTLILNARQVTKHLPAEFLGAKPTGKTLEAARKAENVFNNQSVALSEPYDYEAVELHGAKPLWTDAKGGVLAAVHSYGRGRVVLTTVDYLLPRKQPTFKGTTATLPLVELLMPQIVSEVLPIEVQGDIEYGLSRTAGGWWLYLINNRGVAKFTKTPDELNPAETARVTVDLRALPVARVRELLEDKDVALTSGKNALTIEVGPGDVRVLEITTGPHTAAVFSPAAAK
jgi:sucrose-6-phosphate hydrolase SacC (GH32 family)